MNSRKLLLLGALVVVCAAAVVRLGGSIYSFYEFHRAHPDQRASVSQVSPASERAAAIRFVKDPEPAPPFSLHDIAGRNVSMADLKGKVIILNFWATWCPSCREEIPALIALQTKYQSQLQVIGVSEDEDGPKELAKFAQKAGINYPLVMAFAGFSFQVPISGLLWASSRPEPTRDRAMTVANTNSRFMVTLSWTS
jgi:thiol-disulfide isomerase/thioredoxin